MITYNVASTLYALASRRKDGTVDAEGGPVPTDGFYVGGVVKSLVFDSVSSIDVGELGWFVGLNSARHYGVWADQRDGQIYFDVVDHVETLADALYLGRERGEIAIWDIAASEEVLCALEGEEQDN